MSAPRRFVFLVHFWRTCRDAERTKNECLKGGGDDRRRFLIRASSAARIAPALEFGAAAAR